MPLLTKMFFTTLEKCKHPKCLATEEWLNNVQCMHIMGGTVSTQQREELHLYVLPHKKLLNPLKRKKQVLEEYRMMFLSTISLYRKISYK